MISLPHYGIYLPSTHNPKKESKMNIYEESVAIHAQLGGKLAISPKIEIKNQHDLSIAYTPGVAEVCKVIHQNPEKAYELTMKKNCVAVVTDGSAVLGLGNIGPEAGLPVMEGKALLFKVYADIDAFPICLATQKTEEIIQIVRAISPGFAGINLEDISAPRCFEIEKALQDIGIPVFHDDQHGTAIVLLAALINAAKLANKSLNELTVVINGGGAAGTAIAEMLLGIGYPKISEYPPVKNIIICDSKGIIVESRPDVPDHPAKLRLAQSTNVFHQAGSLEMALKNADVFVGVSVSNVVTQDMVRSMAKNPIIFAMANPIPEIMPDQALEAGAFIVGTGRSDFANQVNNVLAFPGIFRGAIDAKAKQITPQMKLAAAIALSQCIKTPTRDEILPSPLDKTVAPRIAKAVREAYLNTL